MLEHNRFRHYRAWLDLWLLRGLGLLVNGIFGLIAYLALTGEDRPVPQAWPVLGGLAACMLGVFLSWRWPHPAGRVVILASVALGAAALYSGLTLGMGAFSLVAALEYALPYFLVGSLAVSGPGKAEAPV